MKYGPIVMYSFSQIICRRKRSYFYSNLIVFEMLAGYFSLLFSNLFCPRHWIAVWNVFTASISANTMTSQPTFT